MTMVERIKVLLKKLLRLVYKNYGHKDRSAHIAYDVVVYKPKNLYMYEHAGIDVGAVIMNWRAKFIMKKYSGAAFGLKVITGNHMRVKGKWYKEVTDEVKQEFDSNNDFDRDVVVEEDVWIGSNVTLLGGTHLGRGSNIGSGSVIRGNVPPYAVVMGNPAKVVGFTFTPKEVVEHEQALYPENERIPLETLEKNYRKYFLNRLKEIKQHTLL